MTAPRWIAEALDAASVAPYEPDPRDIERLSTALIERLPIEAITRAIVETSTLARGDLVPAVISVLAGGDPEVVELAELYQGACRALDEAGVPYAIDHHDDVFEKLDLAARIRWLAQQRPTRLELQRVESELDAKARKVAELEHMAGQERDELRRIAAERDEQRKGWQTASKMAEMITAERDDAISTGRSVSAHMLELSNQIGQLQVQLSEAKAQLTALGELNNACIAVGVDLDLENEQLRGAAQDALAQLDKALGNREDQIRAMWMTIADREAQISALEVEISALEDQIDALDRNLPIDAWNGCEVGAP